MKLIFLSVMVAFVLQNHAQNANPYAYLDGSSAGDVNITRTSGNYTVDFWVKSCEDYINQEIFFADFTSIKIYGDATSSTATIGVGSQIFTRLDVKDIGLADGNWHHILVTHHDSFAKDHFHHLYVDGKYYSYTRHTGSSNSNRGFTKVKIGQVQGLFTTNTGTFIKNFRLRKGLHTPQVCDQHPWDGTAPLLYVPFNEWDKKATLVLKQGVKSWNEIGLDMGRRPQILNWDGDRIADTVYRCQGTSVGVRFAGGLVKRWYSTGSITLQQTTSLYFNAVTLTGKSGWVYAESTDGSCDTILHTDSFYMASVPENQYIDSTYFKVCKGTDLNVKPRFQRPGNLTISRTSVKHSTYQLEKDSSVTFKGYHDGTDVYELRITDQYLCRTSQFIYVESSVSPTSSDIYSIIQKSKSAKCRGDELEMVPSKSGYSWTWVLDGDTHTVGDTFRMTINDDINLPLQIHATNSKGCTGSRNTGVVSNFEPKLNVSVSGNRICSGREASFYSIKWKLDSITPNTVPYRVKGSRYYVKPSKSGYLHAHAHDRFGCHTSDSFYMNVHDTIITSLLVPDTVCTNTKVAMMAKPDSAYYAWIKGPFEKPFYLYSEQEAVLNVTPDLKDSFEVKLGVIGGGPCADTISKWVHVKQSDSVVFYMPDSFCSDDVYRAFVKFPNSSHGQVHWRVNGDSVASGLGLNLRGTDSFILRAVVNTPNRCERIFEKTVYPIAPPTLPQLDTVGLCSGSALNFTAMGINPTHRVSWNGNNIIGSSDSVLLNAKPSHSTQYVLNVYNAQCKASTALYVEVSQLNISSSLPDTVVAGDSFFLDKTLVPHGYLGAVSWYYDNQAKTKPFTNSKYWSFKTPKSVLAIAKDKYCTDSFTKIVNVKKPCNGKLKKLQSPGTICAQDSVQYQFLSVNSFQWFNGSTQSTIWVKSNKPQVITVKEHGAQCETVHKIKHRVHGLDLGPDRTICKGETVWLGNDVLPDRSYYWFSTDEKAHHSNLPLLEVSPDTTSIYVQQYCGACGLISDTVIVNVLATPYQTGIVKQDISACLGDSITLSLPTSNSYKWLPAKGIVDANKQSQVISVASNQVFAADVFSGSCSQRHEFHIHSHSPQKLAWNSKPDTLCLGLNWHSTLQGATPIKWSFNNSLVDSNNYYSIYPKSSGYVKLIAKDNFGCNYKDSTYLHVMSHKLSTISVKGPSRICDHERTLLNIKDGPTNPLTWSNNQKDTGTISVGPGVYYAIHQPVYGCAWHSDTVTIKQKQTHNVSPVFSDTTFICDSVTTLKATSDATTLVWNRKDTASSLKVSSSGWVHLGAYGNKCPAIDSTWVNISYLPSPVSISRNGDTLMASAGNRFEWFRNGNKLTSTTQQVVIADSGKYQVVAHYGLGCADTAYFVVGTIVGSPEVHQFNENGVTIYPNPSYGMITIESSSSPIKSIRVLNTVDQECMLMLVPNQYQHILNLPEHFAAGTYFLQIEMQGGLEMRKVLIER